jgi:hypothetical protein
MMRFQLARITKARALVVMPSRAVRPSPRSTRRGTAVRIHQDCGISAGPGAEIGEQRGFR